MTNRKITKILIANRGEIALRIIRTAQEMGISTVAVYSETDVVAPHVLAADEAVCLGPGPSSESYLLSDKVLQAAIDTGANGIHPGYGFLSENAEFAECVEKAGIAFIGPGTKAIKTMGDKLQAKEAVKARNIPLVPGTDGAITDSKEALKEAHRIGMPLIIKASAGGGGKGMRIAKTPKDLVTAWELARQESKLAFDNDDMYLEKFIEDPRHIEIQIIGDYRGKASHLSERDCSIQRRHQKLTEETPSPFMTNKLRKEMGEAAIKAAEAVKYEGVGTVEFLVDKNRNFYFMEMNTRIQVEHPITEEVVDFDLIREQIKVAAGTEISGKNYMPQLHAIECRINAEDPYNDFRPCPGLITSFHAPGGHGIRIDTHVYANYMIPPFYDSMIAKVITVAQTREEAISKMERALDEFIIEGIKTTIPFHQALMKNEDFRKGVYTTKFMDTFELK